jgi:hypothetical protein
VIDIGFLSELTPPPHPHAADRGHGDARAAIFDKVYWINLWLHDNGR